MYRQLCFGDNIGVLRAIPQSSIQLCCTDPPFNSGRNYNIYLDSDAHRKAFTDIWRWDDAAIETHADIKRQIGNPQLPPEVRQNYADVERFLDGFAVMHSIPTEGPMSKLRSYLTFMAPRIVEIRRVLKDTGSFYLHCDPSASHYLKTLCDTVFGIDNFRNEIVWSYRRWAGKSQKYQSMHDIIFLYSKSKEVVWNTPMEPKADGTPKYKRWNAIDPETGRKRTYTDKSVVVNETNMRDVWEISRLQSQAKERLGYPTQKPITLYERMIKASSNPGDVVLDPFCGCGTTIDAAETNGRGWIGIDITVLALEPIQRRMRDRHVLEPFTDYNVHGYPCNMQEVELMLKDGRNSSRYKDFEQWAVTRIGMIPTKYVGDGGIDGTSQITLWQTDGMKKTDAKAVCEVKSGQVSVNTVRSFRTSMRDNDATYGVIIGLDSVSSGVKEEMRREGTFTHNNVEYPKVQYWQITQEYFDNPRIIDALLKLPRSVEPAKRLEIHVKDTQTEMDFDDMTSDIDAQTEAVVAARNRARKKKDDVVAETNTAKLELEKAELERELAKLQASQI